MIELILQVLAGMGIAWGADKILPDKVANYQPVSPFSSTIKTVITLVCFAAGAFLVVFLGRKFKIFGRR